VVRFRLKEMMADFQFVHGRRLTIGRTGEKTGIHRATFVEDRRPRVTARRQKIWTTLRFFGCAARSLRIRSTDAKPDGQIPKSKLEHRDGRVRTCPGQIGRHRPTMRAIVKSPKLRLDALCPRGDRRNRRRGPGPIRLPRIRGSTSPSGRFRTCRQRFSVVLSSRLRRSLAERTFDDGGLRSPLTWRHGRSSRSPLSRAGSHSRVSIWSAIQNVRMSDVQRLVREAGFVPTRRLQSPPLRETATRAAQEKVRPSLFRLWLHRIAARRMPGWRCAKTAYALVGWRLDVAEMAGDE